MEKRDCNNPVRSQVFNLPDMADGPLEECFGSCLKDMMETEEIINARRIILTGTGDSYAAAIAIAPVIARYGEKVDVQVMRTIEFTRFLLKEEAYIDDTNKMLVVVISAGGSTSRVIEALE